MARKKRRRAQVKEKEGKVCQRIEEKMFSSGDKGMREKDSGESLVRLLYLKTHLCTWCVWICLWGNNELRKLICCFVAAKISDTRTRERDAGLFSCPPLGFQISQVTRCVHVYPYSCGASREKEREGSNLFHVPWVTGKETKGQPVMSLRTRRGIITRHSDTHNNADEHFECHRRVCL